MAGKTIPPSHKPCFIRILYFREKTSGIWLHDPTVNEPCGLGARRAPSSPVRGTSPHAQPSVLTTGRQLSRTCKYFVFKKSEHLPGALMKTMACWEWCPVLGPKYPFTLTFKACHKKNNYLLGLVAGTDSLGVLSCPFLVSV